MFGTHGGKTATSKMVRHAINPLAIYDIQPLAHFGFQNGIPGDHLNVNATVTTFDLLMCTPNQPVLDRASFGITTDV